MPDWQLGIGLHYIGTELHEAVAMVDSIRAWQVEPSADGGYHDAPIHPRVSPERSWVWRQ